MTLACKTADILALATLGLNHLITGQDTLDSADERKAALTLLGATVRAAEKLADVVHMEALGPGRTAVGVLESKTEVLTVRGGGVATGRVDADGIMAEAEKVKNETERPHAEAEKVGTEMERAVAETERLKAEAMVVRSEKMRIDAETERLMAETERVQVEAAEVTVWRERMKFNAETAETERTRAEAERSAQLGDMPEHGNYAERLTAGIEQVKVAEKVGKEVGESLSAQGRKEQRIGGYIRALEVEIERARTEAGTVGNDHKRLAQIMQGIEEREDRMERWRMMLQKNHEAEGISQEVLNR